MSLYLGTNLISGATKITLETFVDAFYPVGSVFIGTTATCPLAAIKGTWTLVSGGRVLQGASSGHSAGTTINAGLPNITGSCNAIKKSGTAQVVEGAFTATNAASGGTYSGSASSREFTLNIDASQSSSIYGASDTVQPPAYVVNIWERTA